MFIGGGNGPMIAILAVLGVLFIGVMFVLPAVTNRKRGAAIAEMRNSVQKGDVIKTVSGVIGTIVDMEEISPVDKVLIIETGCEGCKSFMRIDFAGMLTVMSKAGQPNPYVECCNGPKADDTVIEADDTVINEELPMSEVSVPAGAAESTDNTQEVTQTETPAKPKRSPVKKPVVKE